MIVIDASPAVHNKAGLGRYAEDLIGALVQRSEPGRYGVFYHDAARAKPSPVIGALPAIASPLGSYPWRLRVLLAQIASVGQDSVLAGHRPVDLFHATEHLLPRLKRAPTVFTLHDLIFRAYPRYHLPRNWIYLQLAIPLFLRRATRVICVSDWTRRDAERLYGLDPTKTTVIHEGVHSRFAPDPGEARWREARAKYQLPDRYILALGTIEPRKNLLTLFDAIARLDNTRLGEWADVPLVVGGRQGWLTDETLAAVQARGLHGRIRFTGFIADEDLPAILSRAALFCFPSLYEGFGLPPLEAMACGVPTVVSNRASLPEVVGDTGRLVEPDDVDALREAMLEMATAPDVRDQLGAAALARSRRFTWDACMDQTMAAYKAAVARG